MRFSQEPAASALLRGLEKYDRYVFNCAPHGRQRALKAKSSERRGGVPVLKGGRTRKYRAYFIKSGSAAKPKNSSAAHFTLIVLSIQIKSICHRESHVTLKAPRRISASLSLLGDLAHVAAQLLTHFLIHTLLMHNNIPLSFALKKLKTQLKLSD